MNFKEIYNSASTSLKKDFLDVLIADDLKMKEQFIEFWKKSVMPIKEENQQNIPFSSLVEKYKDLYLSQLENIDLEPDWDDCHNGSYYRDEWEIAQDQGDEQIEELMDGFKTELLNLILLQNIEEFMAVLLGLYEACENAEITDENYAYEDINEEILNQLGILINMLATKIEPITFDDNKTIEAIKEFFSYIDAHNEQEKEFVSIFEPILLALANTIKQTEVFLYILKNSKVDLEYVPQLTIKLMQLSLEDNSWIDAALNVYKNNVGVATLLLDYYYESNIKEFVVLAKELFDSNKHIWINYLEDKVSIQQDKELYFMVIKAIAIYQKSLSHYIKIRDLFDKESFNLFAQELKYNQVFLVEILVYEKDYETIKLIVKEVKDTDGDFDTLIRPILNIYPDFCFETIKNRLTNKVENERGRGYYSAITKTLLLANNIKGYQSHNRELMLQLYNHKPNLPALRDEFRKAGLV